MVTHFSQVISKYICPQDVRALIEIGDFIGNIYQQYTKPKSRSYYLFLCNKYANISARILKTVLNVYILLFICFLSLGICESLSMGKPMPALRIYLPGVNEDSFGGCFTIMVYNYVGATFVPMTEAAYNALLFIIFANMPMVSSVIVGHLDELKDNLLIPGYYKNYDIERRLLNVILMHNEYVEYVWQGLKVGRAKLSVKHSTIFAFHIFRNIKKLDKAFFKVCFIQISTSFLYCVVGLYDTKTV